MTETMTDRTLAPDFAKEPRAKPYGWIGLPVSFAAILIIGTALCAAIPALAFGIGATILGWHEALARVSNLVQAMKGDPHASELIALCFSILIYLTIAITIFGFARFRGGTHWRDLIAWHAWHPLRRSRVFWIVAIITLVYSLIANEALAAFYPASQDWVTMPTGMVSIILFFIVATISAPLTEELIFRGWLFTALRAKLSLWQSLVISSALFALAHWESTHLYALVVFPVGLALGFIRERADSLKASMSFHAIYNGVAFVLIFFGK